MFVPSVRSGRLACVSVILLVWLLAATCTAMVYRPFVGRFKDTLVLWHQGQFYLFSMYTPDDDANFRNVWSATSTDGVHWKHVGPVIKDAPSISTCRRRRVQVRRSCFTAMAERRLAR